MNQSIRISQVKTMTSLCFNQ